MTPIHRRLKSSVSVTSRGRSAACFQCAAGLHPLHRPLAVLPLLPVPVVNPNLPPDKTQTVRPVSSAPAHHLAYSQGCYILRENLQRELPTQGCENKKKVLAARTFHTPRELNRRTPGKSAKGPPTAAHVTWNAKHFAPAESKLTTATSN